MMNYFDEMHVRMEKYKEVHKRHPRIAILKNMIWNALFFIRLPKEEPHNEGAAEQERLIEVSAGDFNIAFYGNGGIGDMVILANYIYKFRQKYACPKMKITLFYCRNVEVAEAIFGEDIVDYRYCMEHEEICANANRKAFDLFIDIGRTPVIQNRNPRKIMQNQPLLVEYLLEAEKYKIVYAREIAMLPLMDGQSGMIAAINGVKRIQQADIGQLLNVSEQYEYQIQNSLDESKILEKYGLERCPFILLLDDTDPTNGGQNSNKLWPKAYLRLLIGKLKREYPQTRLIRIGAFEEKEEEAGELDLDLAGKTPLQESMVLLKNANLLISNEGGMVHMRHALHGGISLVIFGSTDREFFGYSENINIKGAGCDYPCEWFYPDWQIRCTNKVRYACMWSVTPDMVMNEIRKNAGEIWNG